MSDSTLGDNDVLKPDHPALPIAPPPLPSPLPSPSPSPPVQGPEPISEAPLGDSTGMRMLLPVGRAWQAIVAGYLGLLSILPGLGVLALIFGIWAVVVIRRDSHRHGMGRAIFGIIMGSLGTGLYAIALLGGAFA
jgi:hypothetical protein